jgi:ectoine hydroxylase-related dioxygenase (phytanoyl-CoA dioxygenase family)
MLLTARRISLGDVPTVIDKLERDGYALIENAITPDQVAAAKTDLEAILATTPYGRDDFEGKRTRRVYGLFGKTRALDVMAIHPQILGVLDHVLGEYQLSAPAAIEIGPGERAQPLHPDDAIYPLPRPHLELVVNVMWPFVDFTEANGATRIVTGSQHWGDRFPSADDPVVDIEMRAGSALIYLGSVWHGGGANRTEAPRLGCVLHYSRAWLRPVENHVLVVAPEVVATLPERLQELLGYNICAPFIGYVDGRNPKKLLPPRVPVGQDTR